MHLEGNSEQRTNTSLCLFPVSAYRPVRRTSPGKQYMCGITFHKGTKSRCPMFSQLLGWRPEAATQKGWDCSEVDFRITHSKQCLLYSSSLQAEEEIQTGLVPSISYQGPNANKGLLDLPQRMSMYLNVCHLLQELVQDSKGILWKRIDWNLNCASHKPPHFIHKTCLYIYKQAPNIRHIVDSSWSISGQVGI